MFEIVGREEELAALHAFVGDVPEGPAALVLEGEAGIGKSTLWLAGVEHARANGDCASSRPDRQRRNAASLTRGWAICFEDVLDDVLPGTGTAEAARARGGAPPRGGCRREGGFAGARAGGSRLAATARRGRAGARRDRRRAVARRLVDARARVRAAKARRGARAPPARPAARRPGAALGARAGARRGERPAAAGGAAQRRRAPSIPARPARQALRAPDTAPHPREIGRKPVLRAGARPRSRRGHRPDCSRSRSRRRSRSSCARGSPGSPRPPARRSRSPRRSARLRRLSCERAGVATDALDPAVAAHVIERENGTIRFTHPLLSSVLYRDLGEERRSVHATYRGGRRRPAPPRPSPRALEGHAGRRRRRQCSTTPRDWRPIAARRPSLPSSPSRRSG